MSNSYKIIILLIVSVIIVWLTPFFGIKIIEPREIFNTGSPDYLIFWRLRLPRSCAAFFAGAGLSLCGVIFQAMFRNHLATPYTLGISGGAALGASIYLRIGATFSLFGMTGILFFSLLGSIFSMTLVYAITRVRGSFSTAAMLLAGVILSLFFSSMVMFVQYWSHANNAIQIMRWLMGSITNVEPYQLIELSFITLIGGWLSWRKSFELDLLNAGGHLTENKGVNVNNTKLYMFYLASIVVGTIVSIVGPIGFVGLIVPQICRLWLGYAHAILIPASILIGGSFLCFCDLFARTILNPAEVPIGIITSILGAPFFLWILFRANRSEDNL